VKIKNIIVALCLLLAGCGSSHDEYLNINYNEKHDKIEQVISLKDIIVSNAFKGNKIPVYINGKLKLKTSKKWGATFKSIMFQNLNNIGKEHGIWFTSYHLHSSLTISIDQIFYDKKEKVGVLNAYIKLDKNHKVIFIKKKIMNESNFEAVFKEFSEKIISFIKEKGE
jgi:hypothetical protein